MSLAAALIYWVIIALWLAVLATLCIAFTRNPRTFGTIRLLIGVLLLDTARNIAENFYFGLYFGSQYGLFPASVAGVLGNPNYLILPKALNVAAACVVLAVLSLRWLPLAARERVQAEQEIRRQADALSQETEERRRLFETSLDLILVTDRRGELIRVSPSSESIIGYSPEEMIGRTGGEFVAPEDIEGTRQEMKLARQGRDMRNFSCKYVHKDGHAVPLEWSGVWSEPEQRHYFIGRDMTEWKAAQERLRQLALFDQMTGLPNRASLHEDLGHILAGDSPPTSIAIIELDGFKEINDTLGRAIGDGLLAEVAKRLASVVEASVYRSGGDEFVLLLRHCGDPLAASMIILRAFDCLSKKAVVDGHSLFVSASAGIAIAPIHGTDVDGLVANAGLALREAKAAGGRAYRMYVPLLRAKAQARQQLDTELRRAGANGEFRLHFQPQFRSEDTSIIGAEALLRWHHPERGVLAPGMFIDALAESAAAPEVGKWILQSACRSAAEWRSSHLPCARVAVNLFPAQFRSGTLLGDVDQALAESGLPPEALELEITENIALDYTESILEPLRRLREKGVGIAFDDFGTGFASLSYLTRYPLTRIKIDRSFVQKIAEVPNREDTAIVRSIIAMATNLGLKVTAEGVETPAQSTFLRLEGCDELQGFLFSKPLAGDRFDRFLASRHLETGKTVSGLH